VLGDFSPVVWENVCPDSMPNDHDVGRLGVVVRGPRRGIRIRVVSLRGTKFNVVDAADETVAFATEATNIEWETPLSWPFSPSLTFAPTPALPSSPLVRSDGGLVQVNLWGVVPVFLSVCTFS
jgi:hypothetical protein